MAKGKEGAESDKLLFKIEYHEPTKSAHGIRRRVLLSIPRRLRQNEYDVWKRRFAAALAHALVHETPAAAAYLGRELHEHELSNLHCERFHAGLEMQESGGKWVYRFKPDDLPKPGKQTQRFLSRLAGVFQTMHLNENHELHLFVNGSRFSFKRMTGPIRF